MDDTILFDNAITYKSLLESMYKCKRGVIWKDSVARFIQNSPIEITKLHDELINMTYRMGNPVIFKVYEPKERIIQSLKFRDKVFQKSLCDNVLIPILKNKFIYDNGASLKGKGYSFSLDRLRVHLQKYYNDTKTNKGWVLKCDIHHYFDSMVHEIILNKLSKYFFDERFLFYIEDSLNIYGENGVGIGLGSQINQTIALLYLNDLDHFIKEQLYIKYYGRYMDDFYLIHEDKEYLKYCKNEIKDFIKKR